MKTYRQNQRMRPFQNQESLREYILSNFKYLKGNIKGKYSMYGKSNMLILKREFGNQIQPDSNNIITKSIRHQRLVKLVGSVIIDNNANNRLMIEQEVSV